jgi:hypothetical protein
VGTWLRSTASSSTQRESPRWRRHRERRRARGTEADGHRRAHRVRGASRCFHGRRGREAGG